VKYKDFPLYNATSGFLDGITIAMPIFFMSHYFSETTVGLYALVVRVGNTPLAFISSSVSQINLKKIIDLINTHKNVRLYLFRISFLLLLIVFPFVLVTMLWAPSIFTFFFGNEWYDAGIYLQILVPALGVKFIASTLSSTLGATNNNKLGMIWKIISFVTTIIIFIYFAPKRDILLLLSASMIADIFLYILYYCFIWIAANHPRNYI
jgi:O-antigen/teichoic acid export membrane protein